MDGETNGGRAGAEGQAQGQSEARQETQQDQQQKPKQKVSGTPDWERQIAERDERIVELEGQVAEAAKSAESNDHHRREIAGLTDDDKKE